MEKVGWSWWRKVSGMTCIEIKKEQMGGRVGGCRDSNAELHLGLGVTRNEDVRGTVSTC